ncbi:MAG: DUF488 domain-containing protein [Oscillospiraceae bacterium]|nr:DUF488 domain-containing protein [Oscillospiraceae bacterium]
MNIFTIGYTKKSAERFFGLIRANEIDLLIDVRRYNSTQLAGFSKGRDLEYFLSQICNCEYTWAVQFAPTAALLDDYKSGRINWDEYEVRYNDLLDKQNFSFFKDFTGKRICLLCAEDVPNFCHRRLLAERIAATYSNTEVTHL